MAHDAAGGIVPQHALQASGGIIGAIGDDDHAGMLRVADADAPAVMDGYPSGAGGGVEQGIEQWPIGDCVGAIQHGFGFAVGRGDGA